MLDFSQWNMLRPYHFFFTEDKNTVEPPVCDHPKCKKTKSSLIGGAYKNRTTGASEHIYFMEENFIARNLSYAMCSSMLLLKFFVNVVYSK